MLRADRAAGIVLGDLFKEWITHHAAPNTGERYARDAVRTWDKHIEPRLGRAGLATGGNAAGGLEDVLAALVEQRVETLVVKDGAEAPGTKCVTCGWLGTAGPASCPVDETTLDRVDNVIEPAIQKAIQQSAGGHVLRPAGDSDAPAAPGPVAAVLRFQSGQTPSARVDRLRRRGGFTSTRRSTRRHGFDALALAAEVNRGRP